MRALKIHAQIQQDPSRRWGISKLPFFVSHNCAMSVFTPVRRMSRWKESLKSRSLLRNTKNLPSILLRSNARDRKYWQRVWYHRRIASSYTVLMVSGLVQRR